MKYRKIKAIISGGGTGGHIFPAISIADALKKINPQNEVLFVGAKGKMEMEKVPAAGYEIIGLKIAGLQRKLTLKNIINDIKVPLLVVKSVLDARKIIKKFNPDIVIGVGGFASGPLLWAAQSMKIPTLLQEQNGFAGLTNKLLAKKAGRICVAYEGMERFFPKERIVLTGNPIRPEIVSASFLPKAEGESYFELDPDKKHILIVGGSLGSKTINVAMQKWIENGCQSGENIDIIWQCGKYYKTGIDKFMSEHPECKGVRHFDFIKRMDLAYALADVMISRSGASSISEICAVGKAAVLVPSPNVAEDHQTHNAMALVNKEAGLMVKDCDAEKDLMNTAISLALNESKVIRLSSNAAAMARTHAAEDIVNEAYNLISDAQ